LKHILALLFAVAMVGSAADVGVIISVGPSFPVGQWGRNLSTGIDARLAGEWMITPSLRAGAGVQGMAFGSTDGGSASLTMIIPQATLSWFLRPWGNTFNPGIECAFGLCRSSLSNGTGEDPATWDPAWRAGLRWDFSLGGGFRGRIGADYSSILAEKEQADSFTMLFGFSTEVTL
jgi:hypothetical protein